MRGGRDALWRDEDLAEDFLDKVKDFISANNKNPFFIYYALHQPHVPQIFNPRFVGCKWAWTSGDVIAELDWCVGNWSVIWMPKALLEDTIIIFSSDNGPVLDDALFG